MSPAHAAFTWQLHVLSGSTSRPLLRVSTPFSTTFSISCGSSTKVLPRERKQAGEVGEEGEPGGDGGGGIDGMVAYR